MKRNKIANGVLAGIVTLGLAVGCRNPLNNYTVSDSVQRRSINDYDILNVKLFYDSIGKAVTPSEAAYIEKFRGMSPEDRKALLNDGLLGEFHFLNREDPGIADIVFLHAVEEAVNPALLKRY